MASHLLIPAGVREVEVGSGGRMLRLTNLDKPFWPELHILKRDLLQYYADISEFLLPHLKDRAMVRSAIQMAPAPHQCTMAQVEKESRSPLTLLD